MYSLKIADGDLVTEPNGVRTVTGVERIKQELTAWLLEPLGTDPMYPQFGSRLKSMIGVGLTADIREEVANEVRRVVSNYIEYQMRVMRNAQHNRGGQFVYKVYDPQDIVLDVQDVVVQQNMDVLKVIVKVRLASGMTFTISQEVF